MRSFAATVAVLLATLVAPFAIASTWLTAQVDDRDEYVDTVGDLARDPQVRELLADAAADAAVDGLQQYLPVGLPPAVREWADAAATVVVESPAFPSFWRTANGDLHDQVFAILEDPDAPTDGSITVDASPLVAQVLLQLEDRGIAVARLPDISLTVPVAPESKVAEAGPAYRDVDGVVRVVPVLWLVLVAAALLVARGWRGRVRTLGLALLGVALAALGLLIAADPLGSAVLDRIAVERRELAGVMLDAVTDSLAAFGRDLLLAAPVGVVLVALSLWRRRRPGSAIRPETHH